MTSRALVSEASWHTSLQTWFDRSFGLSCVGNLKPLDGQSLMSTHSLQYPFDAAYYIQITLHAGEAVSPDSVEDDFV